MHCGKKVLEEGGISSKHSANNEDERYASGAGIDTPESIFKPTATEKIIYLSWFALQLIFFVVGGQSNDKANRIWPFVQDLSLDYYDISEFLLYLILPLIFFIIYRLSEFPKEEKEENTPPVLNLPHQGMNEGMFALGVFLLLFNIYGLLNDRTITGEIEVDRIIIALIRLALAVICFHYSKSINRNKWFWAFMGFALTAISPIILAFLKHRSYSIGYSKKSIEEKMKENFAAIAAFSNTGQFQIAQQFLNRAYALDETNKDLYRYRAFLKFKLNDFSGALEDYNQYIEMKVNPVPHIYYNRAEVLYQLGEVEMAISDWRKAASMGYNDAKMKLKSLGKS